MTDSSTLPRSVLPALLILALTGVAGAGGTTIVVTSTADTEADDGVCTLREAAGAANDDAASGVLAGECAAGAGADDILFALPPGSLIALTFAPVVFTESVDLWGPGADALEIAQAGSDRVMIVDGSGESTSSFLVRGLTLSGGYASTSYQSAAGMGGGLLAYRVNLQLTIAGVRFRGNTAQAYGGGLGVEAAAGEINGVLVQDSEFEGNAASSGVAGGGGAMVLDVQGVTTIRRCLFVDNEATNNGLGTGDDGQGGAIWIPPGADGTLEISESTFSANSAFGNGGAISYGSINAPTSSPAVTTSIVDSTFTLNLADTDGDATSGQSGGALNTIWSDAIVTVTNSILAGNDDPLAADPAPDARGTTADLASGGHNFIGILRGANGVFVDGTDGDQVGTLGSPIDAQLEPLADNGGPTASHLPALDPPSPVIDQGSCTGAPSVADQRNWDDGAGGRIHDEAAIADGDDGCDIGAIETYLAPPATIFEDDFETGDWRFWTGIVGWQP